MAVVRLAMASRNAANDAAVDRVNGGAGAAKLRIYGGSMPTDPDTTTGATLLAEVTLANPAFGASASGAKTLTDPGAVTGLAAGTATWCRLVQGGAAAGGAGVIDGDVGATGSGAFLELNTTTISVGVNVDITGGTVTHL